MSFLLPWTERLAKVAETTESLLARMDFDCEVRAWRVSGPPGASLLLGIASQELVTAEALEALRYYLIPRLNARLGLQLRPSLVRIVNLDMGNPPDEVAAIPSELMRKLLGRTGTGFAPSIPAPLATLPLPAETVAAFAFDGGLDVKEFSEDELGNSFDATRPAPNSSFPPESQPD
jgi:hypothetical protein